MRISLSHHFLGPFLNENLGRAEMVCLSQAIASH